MARPFMPTLQSSIRPWDITRPGWQSHLGLELRWERCGAADGVTDVVGAAIITSPSITTTTSSTTATGPPTSLLGATATGSITRSIAAGPLIPTERWQINMVAPRGATPCRIDRRMPGRTRPGSSRWEDAIHPAAALAQAPGIQGALGVAVRAIETRRIAVAPVQAPVTAAA